MSILDRLIQPEQRASFSQANPKDPILAEWFGGRSNTSAGVSVTADSAMRISAVFACVRILSSAIASLPLIVYRRVENDGRRRDAAHPLYGLLHDAPNRWQTSYEFREMQAAHLLLRGNAYAEIVPSGTRAVAELVPLNPDRVRPFMAPDGTVAYEYSPDEGESRIILQHEMHHLRGL
ncbi:MAG TPA: phage portal protein, partial [Guyparkeria sp.]|nr:phage portal protein [Guyparkeria sp.]